MFNHGLTVNLHVRLETEITPKVSDSGKTFWVQVGELMNSVAIMGDVDAIKRLISALEARIQMEKGSLRQCARCGDGIDHERPEVTICLACEDA